MTPAPGADGARVAADGAARVIGAALVVLPIAYFHLQTYPSDGAEAIVLSAVLVGLSLCLARAAAAGALHWPALPITGAWLGLVMVLAAAWACSPLRGHVTLAATARAIIVALTVPVVAGAGPTGRRALEVGLLGGLAIVTGLGLVQALTLAATEASWLDTSAHTRIQVRVYSCMANPNLLGAYLATLLPVVAARALEGGGSWSGPLLAGTIAVLVMTFSRGAWVAAAVGLVALVVVARRGRMVGLAPAPGRARVAVVAVFGALLPLSHLVVERLTVSSDPTELGRHQRTELYRGVWTYAAAVPWLGTGPGTFSTFYPRYRTHGGYYPIEAHGDFLQLACEAGLVAPVLYALFLAGLVGVRAGSSWQRAGVTSAVVAHGASALTVTSGHYLAIQLPLWSILALAVSTGPAVSPSTRPLRVVLAALIVGLGAIWGTVGLVDGILVASGRPGAIDLALRLQPGRDDLWYRRGVLAARGGDRVGALEALGRAALLNGHEPRYLIDAARLQARAGAPPVALALLERAQSLDPHSEEVMLARGLVLESTGRLEEAEAVLSGAIETNPQYLRLNRTFYPRAFAALARVQHRRGRRADAASTRARARELYGDRP